MIEDSGVITGQASVWSGLDARQVTARGQLSEVLWHGTRRCAPHSEGESIRVRSVVLVLNKAEVDVADPDAVGLLTSLFPGSIHQVSHDINNTLG